MRVPRYTPIYLVLLLPVLEHQFRFFLIALDSAL